MLKDLDIRRLQQNRELAEYRKTNELEQAQIEAELAREKIRLAQENDERQFARDRSRVEQEEGVSNYKLEQTLDRDRRNMTLEGERVRGSMVLEAEKSRNDLESQRLAHQIEIEALQQRVEIENSATPHSLERSFMETSLPAIAEAMAKSMNNTRVHIIQGDTNGGGGGTPFRFIMTELLDILRERMENLEKSDTP
jgi:hypothetical protein